MPAPTPTVTSDYILSYSGLPDGTYQIYTSGTYTGVDMEVAAGVSRTTRVNFVAQLGFSAGGSRAHAIDFGVVTSPYSVAPITVTVTNLSGFLTAENVTIESCVPTSYFNYCTDPIGNIGSLAPGQSIDVAISPLPNLPVGTYGKVGPLSGDEAAYFRHDGAPGHRFDVYAAFEVRDCSGDECLDLEIGDSEAAEIVLSPVSEGYMVGDGATSITLTNTGSKPISNIAISLANGIFALSQTGNCASLAIGASCQFVVTPITGLIEGHYSSQLSVAYGTSLVKYRTLSLEVGQRLAPVPPEKPNTGLFGLRGHELIILRATLVAVTLINAGLLIIIIRRLARRTNYLS
jgi:hypothetical protein